MKKSICLILTVVLFLTTVFCCALIPFADVQLVDIEKTKLGTSDTYYEFDADTKTLTISGTGATPNFTSNGANAPWFSWRQTSIDNVVVEEGVTGLGNYCLAQVWATSVSLPNSLKSLGSYALSGTNKIEEWVLPFGLKTIGSYCFYSCAILKSVDIPDTVTTINTRAFQSCEALESIVIPYSVKTLSSYSFYKCSALNSVTFQSLSSSVSIGSYCFAYCSSLMYLEIPMNATMGSYSFSYSDKVNQYDGVSMKVFNNSPAMTYAQANGINYTLFDSIPVECAVEYTNTYTESNMNNTFTYSFVPEYTCEYNVYSRGECDVKCQIYQGGSIVSQNDDISSEDRNFCATAVLNAGTEYIITIQSVLSTGAYSLWIYPSQILSASAIGEASADAVSNMSVAPEDALSSIVLDVNFEGGISDKMYYKNGYFNNTQICQHPMDLTCGINNAIILVGNAQAEYILNVNHTYTHRYVDYTLNEDGYNLYTCVLCGYQYKDDFVPTPAVTVSGNCVLAENPNMEHDNNYPYPYVTIKVNGVEYPVNADGSWSFNTFGDCYAVFINQNGQNQTVHIETNGSDVNFGTIVLDGYDFNSDGIVNGKDFGIFINQKRDSYGMDYWQFAPNFV